jgi:hypothetical protein
MPQRFNWTDRKRISRTDAAIALIRTGSTAAFDATIRLSDYDLPPGARVVIEAYRQTTWRRFGFGTIALVRAEAPCTLEAFGSPDAVLFRLKVLAPVAEDGRILAEADRLRVTDPDDTNAPRRSLLPVQGDDLGEEIFRLSFSGNADSPILILNSGLVDWRQTARTAQFRALVYPLVMRQILARAFDGYEPDEASWQNDWIEFASRFPGVQQAPHEDARDSERETWIDDAVAAFCRGQQFLTRYSSLLTEGGGK